MLKQPLSLALIMALTACSSLNIFEDEKEERIEGERMSLYHFEKTLQKDPNTQFGLDGNEGVDAGITLSAVLNGEADEAMRLDKAWTNKFWPQAGGYPNHTMRHLEFTNQMPEEIWSRSIGEGGDERMPLTSAPVVTSDTVFTLNNDSEVYAFDIDNGDLLWETEVIKSGEDEIVIGGGLGFSAGKLFVTNGFNEVIAIDANDGEILWRTETKAPVRGAPSAIPGRVIVTTLGNETIAFDTANGEKLWSHRGLSSGAGLVGATTPAIVKDAVITTYGSGEVYALQINTGLELWSENLSPLAKNAGQSNITDIHALPVVDDGYVYVTSYNNQMRSIDVRTGKTQWNIPVGGTSTPWVSGNRVFMITTQGELVSINRVSGDIMWQMALPQFEDEDDREDPITWTGPLLAGDQLIIVSTHGEIALLDPKDGQYIDSDEIGDDLRLAPAIANGSLYLVDQDGEIIVLR